MNWTRLYRSIPDRVRLGCAGLILAVLFASTPRLIVAWIRFWS